MRYLAIFLLLLACQTPNSVPQFDAKASEIVAQDTREMLQDYHAAIDKGGLKAEFAYLDSSRQFFWVPPGYESALDFDSVKTILLQNAKAMKQVTFKWETLSIYPLSHELATFQGIVTGNMKDTSNTDFPVHILESGTLIKRPDGWKLLSGQSANLNP
ncbi:MAG: hypothetical protein AAF927_32635 [Bacteroidota bacterium]